MAGGLAKAQDQSEAIALSRGLLYLGITSFALLLLVAYFICFRLTSELGEIRQWWISSLVGLEQTPSKIAGCVAVVLFIYAPVWSAAIAAFQARKHLGKAVRRSGIEHLYLERFYGALAIAFLLLSVIAYIAMFTFLFYPSVPVEFGGGKPYFESFAIVDGQQCQLREIGIPFADDARGVTKPLPVLHESDTIVAVWLHRKPETSNTAQANEGKGWGRYDDVVVQIDKSAIMAIRAFPHARAVPQLDRTESACGASANPPAAAK